MARIGKDGRIIPNKLEEEQLFADCNGLCPICGKSLIYYKNGKCGRGYQAAHIYPHSPTAEQKIALQDVPKPAEVEGLDNIILLCERSHNIQDFYTTKQDYLKLYDIKQRQRRQRQAKESMAEIAIEPEIEQILGKLQFLTQDELIELKMFPVEVKKKSIQYPPANKNTRVCNTVFQFYKSKVAGY